MTVLSVCLGFATMIIPYTITFYISTALLALFGAKMLYEGYNMDPNEGQEELEEVSEDLRKREESVSRGSQKIVPLNLKGLEYSGALLILIFIFLADPWFCGGPRAGHVPNPPEETTEILWAPSVPHFPAGILSHFPG